MNLGLRPGRAFAKRPVEVILTALDRSVAHALAVVQRSIERQPDLSATLLRERASLRLIQNDLITLRKRLENDR